MSGISKKELVKQAYPHRPGWYAKVDKMPESQIVAIYFSLIRQGKIRA